MDHEQYVASVRQRAHSIAAGIVDGSVPVLEGCRTLAALHGEAEVGERDADFAVFSMIDSEVEDLPIGAVRAAWSPEALARLAPEIESAIAWAMPLALPACQSIMRRFPTT